MIISDIIPDLGREFLTGIHLWVMLIMFEIAIFCCCFLRVENGWQKGNFQACSVQVKNSFPANDGLMLRK